MKATHVKALAYNLRAGCEPEVVPYFSRVSSRCFNYSLIVRVCRHFQSVSSGQILHNPVQWRAGASGHIGDLLLH